MRRLIMFGTIIGSLVAIVAFSAAIYYYERPSVLRVAVPRGGDDQAIIAPNGPVPTARVVTTFCVAVRTTETLLEHQFAPPNRRDGRRAFS